MPAHGVYPWSSTLWDTLVDECQVITNRGIIVELLIDRLMEIQKDHQRGLNPFICRERYERWRELAHDSGFYDTLDWDTYAAMETLDWLTSLFDQETLEYEWEIFFDQKTAVREAVEQSEFNENAEVFVERLCRVSPPDALIILHSPDLGAFYVVRSDTVRHCGPAGWQPFLGHVFDDIADALEYGTIDTHVLPDEIIRLWEKAATWQEKE